MNWAQHRDARTLADLEELADLASPGDREALLVQLAASVRALWLEERPDPEPIVDMERRLVRLAHLAAQMAALIGARARHAAAVATDGSWSACRVAAPAECASAREL